MGQIIPCSINKMKKNYSKKIEFYLSQLLIMKTELEMLYNTGDSLLNSKKDKNNGTKKTKEKK